MKELKKAIKKLKKCIKSQEKDIELEKMNLFGKIEKNKKIDIEKLNKIIAELEEMI